MNETNTSNICEGVKKKKRGRKPSKNNKNYFSDKEEIAVLKFLDANSQEEKNRIYNESLREPFNKMVESIIRGCRNGNGKRNPFFIPNEETGTTFNDTLSFLLTKVDKFDCDLGKKAYSYYSNICKNYIIGRIVSYKKNLIRNPSYDDEDNTTITTNELDKIPSNENDNVIASEVVSRLVKRIKKMLESEDDFSLKDSEIKLGKALINLLENWDYVISTDGSNKLNKSAILFFLREQTGLDTKGIRDNMKKYKKEFLSIKRNILESL